MRFPRRSHLSWGWGLFLVGLALRLAHVWTLRDVPLFRTLFIDPAMYDAWARRIAAGRLLSDAPFFLDPLYPYLVGVIYAAVGPSLTAVALAQCVASACVPVLVYAAARRGFDDTVARAAGLLALVYAPSVFWCAPLMKPTAATTCFALALWLLARGIRGEGPWAAWVGGGAAFAAAGLLRGNVLLVLPVVVAWIWLSAPWNERGAPRGSAPRQVAAAAFVAGVMAVLVWPAAHNLAVSGEFIPATVNHGQIFFIGNNPANETGRFVELPWVSSRPELEQRDFKAEAERRAGTARTHRAVSRFWFGQGLDFVAGQPGKWLQVTASKLRIYWGSYETPASLDYYMVRESAPVLRLPLPGFGLVGPFALLGCLLALRRHGLPSLLALLTVTICLATVAFFVLTRFRMVLMPALFLLAGHGLVELGRAVARAIRGRERSRAALLLAALLGLGAFVNLPVRSTLDTWSFRVARLLHLPTRVETTAKAHANLGMTFAARASQDEDSARWLSMAEAELREAIRRQPDVESYVELGKVLARQGQNAAAIETWLEVDRLQPGNYRTRHVLGLLYRRVGELRLAEAAFRSALVLAPQHAPSAVELGEVLAEAGMDEQAREAFALALRLQPDNARARRGLAALQSRPR